MSVTSAKEEFFLLSVQLRRNGWWPLGYTTCEPREWTQSTRKCSLVPVLSSSCHYAATELCFFYMFPYRQELGRRSWASLRDNSPLSIWDTSALSIEILSDCSTTWVCMKITKTRPQSHLTPRLQPEAEVPRWVTPGFLKPTETEIINVCCFKLLNFVVICYEAIYDMYSFASGFFQLTLNLWESAIFLHIARVHSLSLFTVVLKLPQFIPFLAHIWVISSLGLYD